MQKAAKGAVHFDTSVTLSKGTEQRGEASLSPVPPGRELQPHDLHRGSSTPVSQVDVPEARRATPPAAAGVTANDETCKAPPVAPGTPPDSEGEQPSRARLTAPAAESRAGHSCPPGANPHVARRRDPLGPDRSLL